VDGRLFPKELNIPVFMTIKNILLAKTFLIGHGDKGPGDLGYKRMKKVFTNPFSNGCLDGCIRYWSETGAIPVRKNKLISGDEDVTFLGEDNEWLILYSKRNQALQLFWSPPFTNESTCRRNAEYVNLGDWITYFTYGVLMGQFRNQEVLITRFS
jgi:UDP-2,3-diacylglucosamine hydrolase